MSDKCQLSSNPSLDSFLTENPVFTVQELDAFLARHRTGNVNTRKSLLSYYRKQGRLIAVRRGLYAGIPRTQRGQNHLADPFLVASKLTPDAVLAHHTALELLGRAHSFTSRVIYCSEAKIDGFTFQGVSYQCVRVPFELSEKNAQSFGTTTVTWQGMNIAVTGFERTMVDVLTRPDLAGGWEEIWRSLETIEYFDLDLVYSYLGLLDNATTTAKVGFYLEQHREALMVDDAFLRKLEANVPKTPHYMERQHRVGCTLSKRWNLLVPEALARRSWADES